LTIALQTETSSIAIMRVVRLAWLGVRTDQARAMANFLEDVLGLTLDHSGDDEWVYSLPGGGKVEVFGTASPDVAHFTTGPVVGFLVEDVRAATNDLRQHGVPILGEPHFADEGDDVAWAHFRAPDGNVYELTQGHDLEPRGD
jgi:catechol 2,3-dioxygenase-like lactoylglutathione lyase family enzyme